MEFKQASKPEFKSLTDQELLELVKLKNSDLFKLLEKVVEERGRRIADSLSKQVLNSQQIRSAGREGFEQFTNIAFEASTRYAESRFILDLISRHAAQEYKLRQQKKGAKRKGG